MLPGSTEVGHAYFVQVTALAGEDIDVQRAPHRRGRRYGSADAVSGLITR
jgi:hypothetical protein